MLWGKGRGCCDGRGWGHCGGRDDVEGGDMTVGEYKVVEVMELV